MDNLGILLLNALLTAFGFFVTAPILLNAISTFTVQKRFAQVMIEEGIIEEKHVRDIQPKKQTAGVIIASLVLITSFFVASRIQYGLICMSVGFLIGMIRYRKVLEFNSLTVKRFQSTYGDSYDAKKLNQYIDKMF